MFKILSGILSGGKLEAKSLSRWLPVIYAVYILVLVLAFVLGLERGGLLPGHSPAEGEVLQITSSLPNPLEHLLYWPYYVLVWLVRLVISDGLLAARLVSAMAGVGASGLILLILRRRFGLAISLAGTSFFALNSWVLQLARSGTPEMTALVSILGLAAALIFMKEYAHSLRLKVAALTAAAVSWFAPLAPWLVTAVFIHAFYRHRKLQMLLSPRLKVALVATFAGLLLLTAASFNHSQENLFTAFGVPAGLQGVGQIFSNLFATLSSLVWRAPFNPQHWLTQFPLLDIFAAAMLPFGLYHAGKRSFGLQQAYLIATVGVILLAAGLGDGIKTPGVFLLFPLVAVIAAAGLHEFGAYWKRIFPLNPLARIASVAIVVLLVGMSLFYQGRRYYAAWAQHPQTRQIYSLESAKE